MQNPDLDAAFFAALPASDSGAFLSFDDATSDVQQRYATTGLVDGSGVKRIARVVTLPAGFRLCKLTHYDTFRDTLSAWWSSATPFEENDLGVRELFETALLNGVSLREFVRFVSAVSLDWNLLDYYVEIELGVEIKAFWGQFTPQAGIQNPDKSIGGVDVSDRPAPGGDDTLVHYDTSADPTSEVYLPEILGGFGAWQLYVPAFQKTYLVESATFTAPSTDTSALAARFGVPQSRVDALLGQRDAWKEQQGS